MANSEKERMETSQLLPTPQDADFDSQQSAKLRGDVDEPQTNQHDIWNSWSGSTLNLEWKRQGIGPAAFLICDAIAGWSIDPAEGSFDPYEKTCHPFRRYLCTVCRRLCASRMLLRFIQLVGWTLLVVTFLEPPPWCIDYDPSQRHTDACIETMNLTGPPADDPVSNEQVDYYPSTRTVFLTIDQALAIDWVCFSFIFAYMLLLLGRDGFSLSHYFRSGRARLVRIVQVIAVFGLFCSLSVAPYYKGARSFSNFMRIAIIISCSMSIQTELSALVQMTPLVMKMLAVIFMVVFFYAWIGVMVFYGSDEGSEYFSNLVEGLWTLAVCITTANYPDVMMPGYNQNRWVALYFNSFMIVTVLIFMNLILGSIVTRYDDFKASIREKQVKRSSEVLKRTFGLLDPQETGKIDRETIMALFWILNKDIPQVRYIRSDEAQLMFALLDKNADNQICEEEFMEFGKVMMLEFVPASIYTTNVERFFPDFYESRGYQRFRRFIESRAFDIAIDVAVGLNAVAIGIESYPLLLGQEVGDVVGPYDTRWNIIHGIFLSVFCIEISCKMLVLGYKRFSESVTNLYDCVIIASAVWATIYVYYPNDFSDRRLMQYVLFSRVLRLLRLVVAMKSFQIIGDTFLVILPPTSKVFLMMFCIMYCFDVLGLLFFGGMITRDPSNPLAYLILGTDFSENEFWANNFNDLLSGMNLLFNCLIVNNWNYSADGFVAVTKSKYPRLFFLAFHLVGVVMVTNIVVAVVISAFDSQWRFEQRRRGGEIHLDLASGQALVRERQAEFEAEQLFGTKTGLSGQYIARVRKSKLHELAAGGLS